MTTHVVFVDPPRPGLVLPDLADAGVVSAEETAELYSAMVKDTVRAVMESGGDLLVNYRPNSLLPASFQTDDTVEDEVRSLVSQALDDPSEVRFEVQVGSSFDARVGNTVLYLLREEEVSSVAVLTGLSPTVARTVLDSAAMKLRRSEIVLGPAPDGRVSYLGLTDPIEFDGAFEIPVLGSLVERSLEAEYRVDFVPMHPVVESGSDLVTLVSTLRALDETDRIVPVYTMDLIDRFELDVVEHDGRPAISRDGTVHT